MKKEQNTIVTKPCLGNGIKFLWLFVMKMVAIVLEGVRLNKIKEDVYCLNSQVP